MPREGSVSLIVDLSREIRDRVVGQVFEYGRVETILRGKAAGKRLRSALAGHLEQEGGTADGRGKSSTKGERADWGGAR